MGFVGHYVGSPKYCLSTEDYNKYIKEHYHNSDDDEKKFPDWFNLPYCDYYKTHREFTNNVHPYQPTHKVSLSCDYCGHVNIDYYYRYKNNPTGSRECYAKYNTKPCIDCENNFLETNINPRCSPCYTLIKKS